MALDHKYFMREALKEAQKAYEKDEIPVGAVVVCEDRIIARAYNYTEHLKDVTAHAEMQAITSAAAAVGGKYLNECQLYVTLEPCVMCAGAIFWARLNGLIYGAEDDKRGFLQVDSQLLHPKTTVIKDVLAEESAQLLKDFFQQKRKEL